MIKENINKSNVDIVKEHNLLNNFPFFSDKITQANPIKALGHNFTTIMDQVYGMEDTFGLCGVTALHAFGLLHSPSTFKDISYDPIYLKEQFDELMVGKNVERPFDWFFTEKYRRSIKYEAVKSEADLKSIFADLAPTEGLVVAVLCEYAQHEGVHTHWLAAKKTAQGILLVGDLTPFGLQSNGILVSYEVLAKAMGKVLGTLPTTNLSKKTAEAEKAGRVTVDEEGRFKFNTAICNVNLTVSLFTNKFALTDPGVRVELVDNLGLPQSNLVRTIG